MKIITNHGDTHLPDLPSKSRAVPGESRRFFKSFLRVSVSPWFKKAKA